MLDVSASNLASEIEYNLRERDKYLSVFDNLIRQRSGSAYKEWQLRSINLPPEYPENHIHEFMSLVGPKTVYSNPKVRVTSGRKESQQIVAEAVQNGLNDWSDRVRLAGVLSYLCDDFMLMWAAAKVVQVPQPGTDGSYAAPHWPQLIRIPQRRFLMDTLALCPEEARWMGELIIADKDDLVRDAQDPESGWDLKQIEGLGGQRGDDPVFAKDHPQAIDRNQVAYYEVWVRDAYIEGGPTPKDGFNGVIYTIAKGSKDYLRAPRPFYGPPCGPYHIGGVYRVTDHVWPLSPIVAVYNQMDELNAQARAVSLGNRLYKRLVIVDASNAELVQKVQSAPHNYVIPVASGLGKNEVVSLEIGGATPTQIQMLSLLKDRLNRVSGIQDAQRGDVSGGTATEVAVADQASETRMAGIKNPYTEFVICLLRSVAWYLWHDDRVIFPMGEEFARQTGMIEPMFFGGSFDETSGESFDDLQLSIEPYSMERTSEATMQRNAIQSFDLVSRTAPMIPQTPYVDWKALFSDFGNSINMPNLGDRINYGLAAAMGGIPGQAFPDPQNPQLGRQIGQQPYALPAGGGVNKQEAEPYAGQITGANAGVPAGV